MDEQEEEWWQPEATEALAELRDKAIEEYRAGECEPMDDWLERTEKQA